MKLKSISTRSLLAALKSSWKSLKKRRTSMKLSAVLAWAFMVADQVEIQTLSYQEGAEPAHWTCDGSTEFEISEGNLAERGTEITLHINKDNEEFLSKYRLQEI